MDDNRNLSRFIEKKLTDEEKVCVCTDGVLIDEVQRSNKYLAIIERSGDHAIFIFSSHRIPCESSNDLQIMSVIPVDNEIRFQAESPRPVHKSTLSNSKYNSTFLLKFISKEDKYVFELPQQPNTQTFLSEIQRAKTIHSQNAGFGLPPTFSWLEKYKDMILLPPTSASTNSTNPFAEDTFDPLQYMNQTNNNGEEDFSTLTSSMEKTTLMSKSASKESLDFLESEKEMLDPNDPLYIIQTHLGLSSEVAVMNDKKPASERETLVHLYMMKREAEFTYVKKLRIFCGTWNVNGQSPIQPLQHWLQCDEQPPDIYIVGFQELDLSKEAFIFTDSKKESEWQEAVKKGLHSGAKYRKVKLIRLVGVMLILYIKEEHIPYVNFVDSDSVPTGIMGIMGNKGGVAIRMSLHNTSMCFVSSHLAAHQEEFERRNQDYRDIESKIRFRQFVPHLKISEHDIVFWVGDLNYRISELLIDEVKTLILNELYDRLLPFDQLSNQLGKTDVFHGYTEGDINFAPTYKYDPGTDNYDSSEKCRIPAWCDRVLYKGKNVQQTEYRSHPLLKLSDHKPVSALFDVGVKVMDKEKSKKVYEDVMKKLDRLENEYLPQVKLDNTEFVFEDVQFSQSQTLILSVANVGQVPATFEFINKLDESTYCKPWLKISPYKSVILPGDLREVQLEVFVDKSTVWRLNSQEDRIEDILVMHLHGGKDFFVAISGSFIPSSFGSSLEALVQMHGPIREVPTEQLIEIERPGSLSSIDLLNKGGRLYAVPKEIWRLINHLFNYGRHQKDLFRQAGLVPEIQQIRDCLDTGVPDRIPGSIHSVAEAFLLFLECLPEPVIPFDHYQKCLDSSNNFSQCKQIVEQLPECHQHIFCYICSFLRELLESSEYNDLDVQLLSSLFGELLLRPLPGSDTTPAVSNKKSQRKVEEMRKAAFMYLFLTNEYT